MVMGMRDAQGMPVPEGQEEKIMHIALPLANGSVLMGSDNCNDETFKQGNNFYISVHSDSVEEGQKLRLKNLGKNDAEGNRGDLFLEVRLVD